MKTKFHILTILIFVFSCSTTKEEMNKVKEIKLGMTVEKVLEILNIEDADLYIVDEPPLIYRGIHATLKDSTEIAVSFKRTPANLDDISKENSLKLVKKLRIDGFAWKKKNGESEIIGQRPKFWIE